MQETSDERKVFSEIWISRVAAMLAMVSFAAYIQNSLAVRAFITETARLMTKFVF